MLKIWLTWLQPSLGAIGMVLVLSSPFCSTAAPKPTSVSTSKTPVQHSQWSTAKTTVTAVQPFQPSGYAITPDLVVRQLASNAMATGKIQPQGFTAATQPKNYRELDRIYPRLLGNPSLAARPTTKSNLARNKVKATTVANAVSSKSIITPVVPGLFIGNSDVSLSSNFAPANKSLSQPLSMGGGIGAPTPLAAMMAKPIAVNPFPVVRPEMMRTLKEPVIANVPRIGRPAQSLAPVAAIPVGVAKKVPQSIYGNISATTGFQQAPHSLDPIADIPSGLQRLLGNKLEDTPRGGAEKVARASFPTINSLVALKQLVTPVPAATVSAASLQLTTAQAYASVPKFDIPGEKIPAISMAKPVTSVLVVKGVQKDLKTAVIQRKSNYVSLMSDRFENHTKQPWTVVGQRNNLGGLILGSQQLATEPQTLGLLPMSVLKNANSNGVRIFNLANVN